MDIVVILILLVFGLLFGIISAIAGIGGGGFYMSLMVLLFAIPINEARDTSTFIIVFFSFVAFVSYFRHGKVDIKLSLKNFYSSLDLSQYPGYSKCFSFILKIDESHQYL